MKFNMITTLKEDSKLLRIDTEDGIDNCMGNIPNYNELKKQIDLNKWYYTDKKIPYVHNEYGYRCHTIDSIYENDYILTFGCSYSYGEGLFYEDVYATKLAKKLDLKNINLAIPGSGISPQVYNTILFNNNFNKIRCPKYVIYQYPNDYRVSLSTYEETRNHLDIDTFTAGHIKEYDQNGYIFDYYLENDGEKKLKDLLFPLYLNNVWETLNVPVFHITFSDYKQEFKSKYQSFEILDIVDGNHDIYERAKDLSHNGRNFHDKVYKTILKKIKNG